MKGRAMAIIAIMARNINGQSCSGAPVVHTCMLDWNYNAYPWIIFQEHTSTSYIDTGTCRTIFNNQIPRYPGIRSTLYQFSTRYCKHTVDCCNPYLVCTSTKQNDRTSCSRFTAFTYLYITPDYFCAKPVQHITRCSRIPLLPSLIRNQWKLNTM